MPVQAFLHRGGRPGPDGDGFTATSSFGDRPASLTRNSFRYPATVTLDTSVAYDLKLPGSNRVELRFDVFNLLNRTNVATVNNIIGLDPAAPPSTFGTITAVRDQRQAQVAWLQILMIEN